MNRITNSSHRPEAEPALDVDLLLSTPASIVVRARVEFSDGSTLQDAGLVVAREHCRGNRPEASALRRAAQLCAARLSRPVGPKPRAVRALYALVDGVWCALLQPQPA